MAAFTKKAMSLELNPLAIGNITLSARHVLNVLGVHKKYLKATGFQDLIEGNP